MFLSSPQNICIPKSIFYMFTEKPVHCCWNEWSYQPCQRGKLSSPLHPTLVSATVKEAVDTRRDRQTCCLQNKQGERLLFPERLLSLVYTVTPRCCLSKGCLTISSWSTFVLHNISKILYHRMKAEMIC